MAFQAGTRVDPRLMQADYSGFARAGMIRGQAMANLGAKIGSVIEDYKEKKQEKIEKDNFAAALMPYATKMAGGDAAEAKNIVNLFANNPKNAAVVMQFMELGQEQEKANLNKQVVDQFNKGNISAQEALSRGADPASIAAVQGVTEGQDAKKFNESVTLAAESVNGTYDPSQNGIIVDTNGLRPGGKEVLPLSDPMFAPYFATAKGRTMTGRGFDVLGTMSDSEANTGAAEPEVQVPVESIASIPLAAPVEYGQNPSMTEAGEIVHGAVRKGFGSVIDFFNRPVDKRFYNPGQSLR
jgi:hypothetical protein